MVGRPIQPICAQLAVLPMTGCVVGADSGPIPRRRRHTMNPTSGRFRTTARGAQWLLPWLCVLAISASVAHAATVAAAGAASAADARAIISAAHAPANALIIEGRGGYLSPFIGDATCLGHCRCAGAIAAREPEPSPL